MIFFLGKSYIVRNDQKLFRWNVAIKTQNTYHKATQKKGKNSIDCLKYQNGKWFEKEGEVGMVSEAYLIPCSHQNSTGI